MASYKRLGEKIRNLRRKKSLTQEKLAEKANLDPKTIIELESGKRKNPTVKTLNKISKTFGVKLDELLN